LARALTVISFQALSAQCLVPPASIEFPSVVDYVRFATPIAASNHLAKTASFSHTIDRRAALRLQNAHQDHGINSPTPRGPVLDANRPDLGVALIY